MTSELMSNIMLNYSLANNHLKSIDTDNDLSEERLINWIPCYPFYSHKEALFEKQEIHAFEPQSLHDAIRKLCSCSKASKFSYYADTICMSTLPQWGSKRIDKRIASVYALINYPGLFLIKQYLNLKDQLMITNQCLREYMRNPPYLSNLSAQRIENKNEIKKNSTHPTLIKCLKKCEKPKWLKAQASNSKNKKCFDKFQEQAIEPNKKLYSNSKFYARSSVWPNSPEYFKKVRWITLGHHYNWTERSYCFENDVPLPAPLCAFAQGIVQLLSEQSDLSLCSEPYTPDAAIVNLYHKTTHRLGGHRDDVEQSQNPLVSISLGLPALFLFQNDVTSECASFLLQSGDVLLLTSDARQVIHGVPRIFKSDTVLTDQIQTFHRLYEASDESMFLNLFDASETKLLKQELLQENNLRQLFDTLTSCRINISIRQCRSHNRPSV